MNIVQARQFAAATWLGSLAFTGSGKGFREIPVQTHYTRRLEQDGQGIIDSVHNINKNMFDI